MPSMLGAAPPPAVKPTPIEIPDGVRHLFNQALQQQNIGDIQGALELYRQIIEIFPILPDAYNNLAILLKGMRRLDAAVACLKRAILYAPASGPLYSNLGNLLWMNLEFEESMAAFRRALELAPDRPETLHNLGLLHFSLGDYRAAVDCYDRALALKPDNNLVRWDRALALLAGGDLRRGFEAYDVRFDLDDPTMRFDLKLRAVRTIPLPLWRGEDLAGKTIYVYAEQGAGDTIQFARFIPLLARRGARVIFDCPPDLVRLLSSVPGIAELRSQVGEMPLPQADFQMPLLSLPARFGITLETVPAQVPYLRAPLAIIGPSVPRPPGVRLTVGIVWGGRPEHTNDHNRSMPLQHFLSLADLPGVALYSLQKGPRAQDLTTLAANALVYDLGPQIQDFVDTARMIEQLDVVISIDTSVVHLAGALGRPCFVLLPYTPDWRWLNGRDDTPWYPTLRLFRQARPTDWKGVMQRVRGAIAQIIARR
ncbi:MAG TPA: tetratricopeptide repeat-containing glycosyltransferase family protein [Stellaceae bacterium]|nr:tetratricopeptide repeat-containing glycosyltransferase family protein [Stellaceae bacterium]